MHLDSSTQQSQSMPSTMMVVAVPSVLHVLLAYQTAERKRERDTQKQVRSRVVCRFYYFTMLAATNSLSGYFGAAITG